VAPAHLYTRGRAAGLSEAIDAGLLAADLSREVRGEVRFDVGSRAVYATDASNYRQVPLGVVVPADADDVVRAVAVARRHRAAIFGRGAGTSLAGQCCNHGIVVDFSKTMNRILEVNAATATARVEPGVVLDDLRAAAARHGLTFGPDPATHAYCTVGGMIGNNSCGVHSVMAEFYGPGPRTSDNIEALEILTYRGARARIGATSDATLRDSGAGHQPGAELLHRLKVFRDQYAPVIRRDFPVLPRRVSGYNLPALLPENGFHVAQAIVGSESTLAMVLEATVQLIQARPHRVLVVVGFTDIFSAADRVPEVRSFRPVGLEGLDSKLADDLRRSGLDAGNLRLLPDGRGWLLVEFGGDSPEEAARQARVFAHEFRNPSVVSMATFDTAEDQNKLWEIRESGLAATARVRGRKQTWPGWEDAAVPPERFGDYLRAFDGLLSKHEYDADLYGHFGQGCLHCRIDFDLQSTAGIARFRRFVEEAADLVHLYGGSLSGEHGDGQARGALLGRIYSAELLGAFREFKAIWDPDWKMNPGKLIEARPVDADLRLGARSNSPEGETWFEFPEDGNSFARATLRCVGVGKCRKTDSGTMCPSYMVTREERHSTRGRARLLFEMLEGDPLNAGWRSEDVREALDLCLSCKGCKAECPVHVDMATYKAEFLAHYYTRHWRPRSAYAFGLIGTWARLAALAPRVVNSVTQVPVASAAAKWLAGMSPARRIPAFAPQTFRQWFRARQRPAAAGPRVLLWPDTFNDHFHPETLQSAVEVLEAAGFTVDIPRRQLCCGRPLYDYGMLGAARGRLQSILTALENELAQGVPIVGLEPSCVVVFRDELANLLPDSQQVRRLRKQVVTLAELLAPCDRLPLRPLSASVLVHGHCHHKAIIGLDADRALLDRLGVTYHVADSGCCGMAGSFGFERDHREVSMAIGERGLLPAVRTSPPDTVIVADGFSCREQIAQMTDRRGVHLADLLRMAVHAPATAGAAFPERRYVGDYHAATLDRGELGGLALAATGVLMLAHGLMRYRRPC
jgi:FAD/FMN-containing dehydrogenase/Fe-S oxidoreductase